MRIKDTAATVAEQIMYEVIGQTIGTFDDDEHGCFVDDIANIVRRELIKASDECRKESQSRKQNEATLNFNRGYACAVACIVEGHGESTETREALSANGMETRNKAMSRGIDEYDLNILFPKAHKAKR